MDLKKRVAIITGVPYGSTGKIAKSIAEVAKSKGMETLNYFGWTKGYKKGDREDTMVGSFLGKMLHMVRAKITGKNGCYSKRDTKKLLKQLDKFKPDVINLHILHCWFINLPMLFNYIKKNNLRVVWEFHDCWAFTGQCPYFDIVKCDKWKSGCYDCPQYRMYPDAFVDKTEKMYKLKNEWFTGVGDMTIVTPSKWLGDLVKKSFLKEYDVEVVNNGIDLEIFKPTESHFRQKYGLENKKTVLGVAFDWGKRKGLDVFKELAGRLPSDYQIVLVGTNDEVDKELPTNIISIHRTTNQTELAQIYTASDVFVNPTREENFPTVNMEALACGTPVVTFKTGGSPEIIDDSCGIAVDVNDTEAICKAIIDICENKRFSKEACFNRASGFDMNDKFKLHCELFEKAKEKAE